MDLPETLHGQLYLLAFDRKQHRFDGDNLPLMGLVLRAAMLTDLHLAGYIGDVDGKAHRLNTATPTDPLLRAMCGQVGSVHSGRRDWVKLISDREDLTPAAVRDQLGAAGWLSTQRSRTFGIIPTARLGLSDEDAVGAFAEQVAEALRNAIGGRDAEPRPLAAGLLAALCQMPTMFSVKESSRYRQQIRDLVFSAIAPIVGLQQAIEAYYEDIRVNGLMPRGWISNRLTWS